MIIGDFNNDLDLYLTENRGRPGSSKQSDKDLSLIGSKSKGQFDTGKMYTFRYFTEDEPFYDTYPIIIGLGNMPNGNQLGINLHYIPYDARIPFLKDVRTSFSGFISTQIKLATGKPQVQGRIKDFTYEAVKKSIGKKYNIAHAVKQYRLDRIKKPRVIGYEDWYVGAVNDENYFFGGNINQAQALYYKNI